MMLRKCMMVQMMSKFDQVGNNDHTNSRDEIKSEKEINANAAIHEENDNG